MKVKELILGKGFEITGETEKEIQKSMVDTHIYHLTGKMPNELTFQWDMFANEPSPDLEAIKGALPPNVAKCAVIACWN